MNKTAIDRAINPPKTTLTKFFELCNRVDVFSAQHERYSIQKYYAISNKKMGAP